jgi:hypothetical protein
MAWFAWAWHDQNPITVKFAFFSVVLTVLGAGWLVMAARAEDENDNSGKGDCPKDSVSNGTPVTVNAHPPTETPAPLPTGSGVPGIGPSPTSSPTSGGVGVGIPVPTPPADALAAWQTVPQDDAQELPTTFEAISGDLLATDQVPDPFTKQEGELDQLATIPFGGGLGEDTPAQQAEAKADLADLDNFFSTPGLMPSGG